ncbi:hypothetical protein HMPREF2738_01447 [Clostridiales bacterium KLE1615]|nr:hypothetical protein HMPREF2738_01447 [Clostridiales bacterium KLE1615]
MTKKCQSKNIKKSKKFFKNDGNLFEKKWFISKNSKRACNFIV